MKPFARQPIDRRTFLSQSLRGTAAFGLAAGVQPVFAAATSPALQAGEGVVNTTPPTGIELAGFHRPPGNPRLITGLRQPTAARALVVRCGQSKIALVSLDILGVSHEFTQRVQRRVARETGIPAENIRICATHTHSMPTFRYLRQWGKIPEKYLTQTADSIVEAIQRATEDLAPAELHLGKSRAQGANFNRTTNVWKTDAQFDQDATDDERWLDTLVHVLRFERSAGKPPLLWYHFSAHPVCYGDGLAGPDWLGGVIERVQESEKITPAFLQGHAGDVNPGDGSPWIGEPQETASGVYAAIKKALDSAVTVSVKEIRSVTSQFDVPLDLARLKQELETYRQNPAACTSGPWVDQEFATEWFHAANDWKLATLRCLTPLSAIRLGPIGMVFHSSELYSFYGLAIQHASPCEHTLVVGYTDDLIGYLTDPQAYTAGEYAAVTVPKILDYPPFTTTAARRLTTAAQGLLNQVSG